MVIAVHSQKFRPNPTPTNPFDIAECGIRIAGFKFCLFINLFLFDQELIKKGRNLKYAFSNPHSAIEALLYYWDGKYEEVDCWAKANIHLHLDRLVFDYYRHSSAYLLSHCFKSKHCLTAFEAAC